MELETLTVVMAIAGAVLLYGAIKNKNPIDVVKKVLQGGSPNDAAPLASSAAQSADLAKDIASSLGLVTTVPGNAVPAGGNMHTNGTSRFFPNNTPRYTDDPLANTLPAGDPRKRFVSGLNHRDGFVMAAKDATRGQGGYVTGANSFGEGGVLHPGIYNG